MKSNQIKVGETYTLVATEAPGRKHLEGQPFTVTEIKNVFRRLKFRGGTRKVKRFFNAEGDGARAEELEPQQEVCETCGGTGQVERNIVRDGIEMDVPALCTDCDARLKDPFGDDRCTKCGYGVMEHTGTSPGQNESRMTYTCSYCGHEERFP